jgi:hypothetical protein
MAPSSDSSRLARRREQARARYWADPVKARAQTLARRNSDLKRAAQWNRNNHLKLKYGLSRADYDAMLQAQDYACAICRRGAWEFSRGLAVDHDHETGKVRGLLCSPCNSAIGQLQECPETMLRAISYLS